MRCSSLVAVMQCVPYVMTAERAQVFASNVAVAGPDDCWLWTAGKTGHGYGAFAYAGRTLPSHRLLLSNLLGSGLAGLCVCHRCDVPLCHNPTHLWAGTVTENNRDRERKGRSRDQRGAKNFTAKLTDADVREIRRRYAAGEYQKVIAADYGMTQTGISAITRGRTWRHL